MAHETDQLMLNPFVDLRNIFEEGRKTQVTEGRFGTLSGL